MAQHTAQIISTASNYVSPDPLNVVRDDEVRWTNTLDRYVTLRFRPPILKRSGHPVPSVDVPPMETTAFLTVFGNPQRYRYQVEFLGRATESDQTIKERSAIDLALTSASIGDPEIIIT